MRLGFGVLLALMVSGTWSQPAQPPQKDPQSAVEPRSGPGAGQEFLKRMVGEWEVVKRFHPRTGEPVEAKGECKQSMMHENRFLKSEFVFTQGNTRTTGLGIIGFEPQTGLFTSVWTDSRATRMSFRKSQEKFNGKEIVLFSQTLEGPGGENRRSRTVTMLEDGDKKLVHRQFNQNPDGSERVMMELLMTRKATTVSTPEGK